MRPHPKIRKTVKWGGAAVSVLLAVVWVGSRWWWVAWASSGAFWIDLFPGRIRMAFDAGNRFVVHDEPGWSWGYAMTPFCWWFDGWHVGPEWHVFVPLWPAVVLVTLITVTAWRVDALAHRRCAGQCVKCGYDRAGIAAGAVCPECGAGAGAAAGSQK